jgi:hypothetical protein
MSNWEFLAWLYYAGCIFLALSGRVTWEINYRTFRNPLVKVVATVLTFFIIGLALSLLGLVFGLIGKFLLLPWKQLFW